MSRQTNLGLDNGVAAPVDVARPIVSGTPRVGQILTVRNAVWFKGVTGATYQWRRNGVNISGATNQTYTLVSDDEEKFIDCLMVGTNAQGNDESLSDQVLCYTTVILPAATLSTRAFSLQALSGAELAAINTNFSGAVIERISPNDGRLLVSSDGKLIRGMSNTSEEPFELSIYTTHPKAETKRTIIKVTFVDQNVFTTFAQLLNGKQRAGVSLAGLEFAGESLPGKLDVGGQGPRPTPDSVPAYWATQDVTNFRIPIPWERLQPDLNGPLGCIFEPKSNSAADIADPNRDFMVLLTNMFAGIAKVNGKFIFDIHNYAARGVKSPDGVWITSAALAAANNMPVPTGRNGKYAIGSAMVTIDHFANLHERIAEEFLFGRWRPYLKNLAGIDFMNEPVQLPNGSGTVRDMYQAALNKSRAVGYRGLAFLEGYVFASFADWSDYATPGTLDAIVDPAQNIVWSGHDYDDANHTGTYTGDEANKPVYGQLLTRGASAVLGAKSLVNWVSKLTPEQKKYTAGIHMGETNTPNTREWQEAQRLKFVALRDANCLFHVWAAWTVEVERVLNVLPVPFATNRGPDKIVTDLLRKVNNADPALNTPIGLGQIIVPALTGNPGGAAQMDNGAGGKTAAVVTNRTVGATIVILLKSAGVTVATLNVNSSGVIIGALPPSATYDIEVNQTLGGLTYKQTFTGQMVITGADTTGSILLDGFESTNDAAGNARTVTGTGATISAANTRKVEGSLGITLTPADQTNRTVAVTAANLGSHDPATMDVLAYYQDYAESGLNRITDQNFQITRNGVTASKNNGDIAYPGGDWHAYAVSEMSNGASFASQPAGTIAASMRATQTGAEITFDALLKNAKGIPIFMFNYDDISSSQYENAFPLHVEFGFPATFFVPRDFVGNGGRINESQLATMYNSGIIDFGCDSTRDDSGANIADTDADRAAALASLMANHDYLVSKGWMRNETHKHLCWANNNHSARLAQHFQENGFRMMRSTIPGLSGVNYVKHGIGRGRAKKLNSNPSLGTYTFDSNYKATVDRALAVGGLWSMHMHGFSTSGNDTRPAEIRLLMEYLKPLVDAGKALVCSFGEAWSRFGGFTSNVVLNPSVTLGTPALSASAATVGTPFTATISGKSAGSTITLSGAGAAGLSVSGTTVSGTPTTAGPVDLVETLAGAIGSPKTTSGAATVSVARPLRLVATRGEVPTTQGTVSSTTNMRFARTRHFFGDVPVQSIAPVYCGYVVPLSSGEIDVGNATPFVAFMEYNGTSVPVLFGGSPNGSIPNGAAEYIADAILPSAFGLSEFPANAEFFMRQEATLATNAKFFNCGQGNKGAADTCLTAPTGTASIASGTGDPGTPTGWTAAGAACWMPCAFIGRTTGPAVSIVGVGDSILWGSNDSYGDGTSNGSFLKRALNGNASRRIAFTNTGTPGTRAGQFFTSGVSKRAALFKYATHVLCEYMTNDWSFAKNASQSDADALTAIQGYMQAVWSAARNAGCKVWQTKMFPRCNAQGGGSTDSFATAAGQTPSTGLETGGTFRDPWHTWLASRVGIDLDGRLDGPIEANQDASQPDRWKTNGTALRQTNDGLHLSGIGHGDAMTSTRTWAYGLTGS